MCIFDFDDFSDFGVNCPLNFTNDQAQMGNDAKMVGKN